MNDIGCTKRSRRYLLPHMFRCFLSLLLLAILGGCTPPPAVFAPNLPVLLDYEVPEEHRAAIADILAEFFGAPDAPRVPEGSGLDLEKLKMAAGPTPSDLADTSRGLYQQHCSRCHGITGDGQGVDAQPLDPYPRDFRQGTFKYKHTQPAAKPTDDDLRRQLLDGNPGTDMEGFDELPDAAIDALAEYVKYLAMRGEVEIALARYVRDDIEYDDNNEPVSFDFEEYPEQEEDLLIAVEDIVAQWTAASEHLITPNPAAIPPGDRPSDSVATSVTRGRLLFYGSKANCVKCHGPTALGDGQTDDWNVWNKDTKEFLEKTDRLAESLAGDPDDPRDKRKHDTALRELKLRKEVAGQLLPVRNIHPRNLRLGVYAGGDKPLDFHRRVHAGIWGTPMPATSGTLTEEELWQVVDYIRSLPDEPASQAGDPNETGPVCNTIPWAHALRYALAVLLVAELVLAIGFAVSAWRDRSTKLWIRLILAAGVLLFVLLVGIYSVLRVRTQAWPSPTDMNSCRVLGIVALLTLIGVCASVAMAAKHIRAGSSSATKGWLWLAVVCGGMFLTMQAYELYGKITQEVYALPRERHIYNDASVYYAAAVRGRLTDLRNMIDVELQDLGVDVDEIAKFSSLESKKAVARAAELRRRREVVDVINGSLVAPAEQAIREHPLAPKGLELLQHLADKVHAPKAKSVDEARQGEKTASPPVAWNAAEPWLRLPIQISGGHEWFLAYFLLASFHALHVLSGIAVLAVLLFLRLNANRTGLVADVGRYWYFLGGVWVVVFVLLYV